MVRGKNDKSEQAETPTPTMNEWGLPDWRESEAYGDVKRWTFNRWRWEFYRRRDDLRAFFDLWADDSYSRNLRCNSGRLPNEPGFLAFGRDDDAGAGIRCFDYAGVPNPRIGNQPEVLIMPSQQIFHKFRFYNPVKRKPQGRSVLEALGARQPRIYELKLQGNEYAIKFDLDKPLRSQVEEALQILRTAQIELHGKAVHRKNHKEKWLDYLRTLDARAAAPKASWRSFTEALFSAGLLERHKNTSGGYCDPPPQAGRDKLNAANALRFNF